MSFTWSCACGKRFRLDESKIGQQARCPACGAVSVVKAPEAASAEPAAASALAAAASPAPSRAQDEPVVLPTTSSISGTHREDWSAVGPAIATLPAAQPARDWPSPSSILAWLCVTLFVVAAWAGFAPWIWGRGPNLIDGDNAGISPIAMALIWLSIAFNGQPLKQPDTISYSALAYLFGLVAAAAGLVEVARARRGLVYAAGMLGMAAGAFGIVLAWNLSTTDTGHRSANFSVDPFTYFLGNLGMAAALIGVALGWTAARERRQGSPPRAPVRWALVWPRLAASLALAIVSVAALPAILGNVLDEDPRRVMAFGRAQSLFVRDEAIPIYLERSAPQLVAVGWILMVIGLPLALRRGVVVLLIGAGLYAAGHFMQLGLEVYTQLWPPAAFEHMRGPSLLWQAWMHGGGVIAVAICVASILALIARRSDSTAQMARVS